MRNPSDTATNAAKSTLRGGISKIFRAWKGTYRPGLRIMFDG